MYRMFSESSEASTVIERVHLISTVDASSQTDGESVSFSIETSDTVMRLYSNLLSKYYHIIRQALLPQIHMCVHTHTR